MKYAHLAARLFDTPLMIQRGKLETIAKVLSARIDGDGDLALEMESSALEQGPPSHMELEGQPGLAVIPVHDSLVHRGLGSMNALSGLRSYLDIGQEFQAAMEDPDVGHVVLDIDSPGGEVAGLFELADMIVAARGTKPITALVNDTAASAAYVLASAADRIVVGPGSMTGSIGVIMVHRDQSQADAAAGLKFTEIHAGARKADGSPHRPLQGESLAAIQATVDALYTVMVETIARNRGITPEAVMATEAGVYVGAAAVRLGLADAVGTVRSTMAEATELLTRPTVAMEGSMSENNATTPPAATGPDLEKLRAEAAQQAREEERARCAGIRSLAKGFTGKVPGIDAVAQAALDEGLSIAEAQAKILGHVEANLDKVAHQNARAQDEAATPEVPAAPAPSTAPATTVVDDGDEDATDDESLKAQWGADADLRADFLGDFETFAAYRRAKAEGRFEVYGQTGRIG